jgi:hypothetical protein
VVAQPWRRDGKLGIPSILCGPFAARRAKVEEEYPYRLAGRYRCSLYGRRAGAEWSADVIATSYKATVWFVVLW